MLLFHSDPRFVLFSLLIFHFMYFETVLFGYLYLRLLQQSGESNIYNYVITCTNPIGVLAFIFSIPLF